jgi:hypothetical protein
MSINNLGGFNYLKKHTWWLLKKNLANICINILKTGKINVLESF